MIDATAHRSVFNVPQMDCPSEERMVRMALEGAKVTRLEFDLGNRRVTIWHTDSVEGIGSRLERLGYGARLHTTERAQEGARPEGNEQAEARLLRWALVINAGMFVVELIAGFIAQSMGLVADSLDMFADAGVYAISLYAVGRAASVKVKAAHLSGWLQMALAAGALIEVTRRFVVGSEPESAIMMAIAALALVANVTVLKMLSPHSGGGAHMKASQIFTANDVVANLGVILAGVLVMATGSRLPDLVLGAIIAVVVFTGAIRILRLH